MARSVPQTFNRPGASWVEPRKTAANAGNRSEAPKLNEGPLRDTKSTPAKPLIAWSRCPEARPFEVLGPRHGA